MVCAHYPVSSSVNTFVFLHSWVLALHWADSRIISPVIVSEGPGAGGGQGAGPLTILLERGTVQTGARAASRAGSRPSARGRARSGDSSHRGTVHRGIFVSVAGRWSVLRILALLSPLLIWITVCVHSHWGVSLRNRRTGAACNSHNTFYLWAPVVKKHIWSTENSQPAFNLHFWQLKKHAHPARLQEAVVMTEWD